MQIHAQVNQQVLSNVSEFFKANVVEIINELLLNSYRAKATVISLSVTDKEFTIEDNGIGCHAHDLLNLGAVGWPVETQVQEACKGYGFFRLVNAAFTYVESKNWGMYLTPNHFLGQTPVDLLERPWRAGTLVRFNYADLTTTKDQIRRNLETICEHIPIPIYLNGQRIKQEYFLADCNYAEHFDNGYNIGISSANSSWVAKRHGFIVKFPFSVNRSVSFKIDLSQCSPSLMAALALSFKTNKGNPAREELRQDCLKTYYRFVERYGLRVENAIHWKEAQSLGIQLPEPPPVINRWSAIPRYADYSNSLNPVDLPPKNEWDSWILIYPSNLEKASDAFAVQAGFQDYNLAEFQNELDGFDTYNAFVKARGFELKEINEFTVTLINPNTNEELVGTLPYIWQGDEYDDLYDHSEFLINPKLPTPSVSDLVEYLSNVAFHYDEEGDSFETQEREFTKYATQLVQKKLMTADEYLAFRLLDAWKEHCKHLIPKDKIVTMTVTGQDRANPKIVILTQDPL